MEEHKDVDTATRILEAAIRVIERDGIEATTTRAIAEEASANLALINYYYRSKDALMRTVMRQAWENAVGDFRNFAEGNSGSAVERLEGLLAFLLDGKSRFPRLSRAMLAAGPGELFPGDPPLALLNSFIFTAVNRAQEELACPADSPPNYRAAALASAVLYPLSLPGALVPSFGLSLEGEAERRAYIACLITTLRPASR